MNLHKLNWVNPKISIGKDARWGRMQIANSGIKKDELLVVYGGHVIDVEEYNIVLMKVGDFPYQISENPILFFSPTLINEVQNGDFFNHSCSPNSGFKSEIHLVAMRDILAGEQITFDYSICMTIQDWKMVCDCNSTNCRKIITGEDWKIKELQLKYRGYFQPYIEQKILGI
jgi:uncharacterized protein